MRELFTYYRVRSGDEAAAFAAVRNLHAQLRARYPGLRSRLLRRPEEADGQQTWMETYTADPVQHPDGVSPDLQADIETRAAALLTLLCGPRRTEVFVACVS